MRVLLITATPDSVAGGSGTHVATGVLRAALQGRGHTVRVRRPGPALGWIPGFTARRFAFNRLLHPATADDADLVVGLDMDGAWLAGRTRPPFVAYLHGVIADEASFETGLVRALLRLQAAAEARSARAASLVLAPSEYSRSRIATLYGVPAGRIAVVPPGIDLARWDEALGRAGAGETGSRKRITDPGPPFHGPPVILVVAHLYPRKNLAQVIRAVPAVRRARPDVEFRIVGDGPQRRRLERLARTLGASAAVRFLGHIPFTDLAREYARCTVFCLPTRQEGFGLVFAEAMAAGRPVVAARAGAVPELVRDGVEGLLVSPEDPGALAAALVHLLAEPGTGARMGAAGRQRVEEFTVERMVTRFLDTVAPLLAPART